jgi:hypothetical protein
MHEVTTGWGFTMGLEPLLHFLTTPTVPLRVPSGVIDPCGRGISGRTQVPYCATGDMIPVITYTARQYNVTSGSAR